MESKALIIPSLGKAPVTEPRAEKALGELGSRSVFQWCKDHPKTIAAILLTIVVAASIFALAPYLAVFALAAAFSAPIILPSLTLVGTIGAIGGAAGGATATTVAILAHTPTLEQIEERLKNDIKDIRQKSDRANEQLGNQISSTERSLTSAEDELDTYSEIEDIWKALEQAEVDEANGKPDANLQEKKVALEEKIGVLRTLEDESSRKIVNAWNKRTLCKRQLKDIEQKLENNRAQKIKKIRKLRDSYAKIPGHDPEKIEKIDSFLLKPLETAGTTKIQVLTRKERREMFGGS